MGAETMNSWQAFRCPLCGHIKSYPPAPAGPGIPSCTYAHYSVPMEPVSVASAADLDGSQAEIEKLQDELALSRHYRDDLSVRVENAKNLVARVDELPGSWGDTLREIALALEGGRMVARCPGKAE